MPQDSNALVWIDLEMTGLDPERERIIEIASIVTDAQLNIIEEGPVLAVHQDDNLLTAMDAWNTRTHYETGLIERVRNSTVDEIEAEMQTLKFLRRHVTQGRSPLCGNTVYQDRRFLRRYMPGITDYLHYRNLDISTIKELAARWYPAVYNGFAKQNTHRALDDIRESIAELQYYRENIFLNSGSIT